LSSGAGRALTGCGRYSFVPTGVQVFRGPEEEGTIPVVAEGKKELE